MRGLLFFDTAFIFFSDKKVCSKFFATKFSKKSANFELEKKNLNFKNLEKKKVLKIDQ